MERPINDFRKPAEMSAPERRAEIVALVTQGLRRYEADSPAIPPTVQSGSEEISETPLNQLDARATKSVYAADENA